jgi:predicted RNA-binding Zn-ribbon protein involved in translation (DUF1610 family)
MRQKIAEDEAIAEGELAEIQPVSTYPCPNCGTGNAGEVVWIPIPKTIFATPTICCVCVQCGQKYIARCSIPLIQQIRESNQPQPTKQQLKDQRHLEDAEADKEFLRKQAEKKEQSKYRKIIKQMKKSEQKVTTKYEHIAQKTTKKHAQVEHTLVKLEQKTDEKVQKELQHIEDAAEKIQKAVINVKHSTEHQ